MRALILNCTLKPSPYSSTAVAVPRLLNSRLLYTAYAADEVRMVMRVEAVWRPREEWGTTIENISHFRPTGEPDADYETYKQHL